ncbi:DUF1236 domain-containing protein [Devosia rhizoryzae]|uniref:DUF1236 domain-containing protein n=1 Tax=Devosia rhizoryzae TaxID=2774137 RepID=A0ABX7C3M3_9HYPH|nr:DUF1236 domain-containing protein [Devosia rhizoryzae]QQR38821.1 DUF1236 domain-containing protein [Devosia rhizoryzae]
MKNLLLASVAALSLGLAAPAFAQGTVDADAGAAIGATGGGTTGAVVGGLLGGPIGAVVGGFAGAVIGAEAGVASSTIEYAGANPVAPVTIDGDVAVGYVVPQDVTVYPVQGDDQYGYIYANGRVWIVDNNTRALVQSPGYLVSQSSADYAIANPIDPIEAQGDVVVGYVLPEGATITPVPDDSYYGYVYINGRPALVDNSSRTVVYYQ